MQSRHAEFREEAIPFVIYNNEKRSKQFLTTKHSFPNINIYL